MSTTNATHTVESLIECSFHLVQCPHVINHRVDEQPVNSLFQDHYKRTNRTKDTKIVRCFPHCCPEHRERSYCGAALHLLVSAPAKLLERIVVFARFEQFDPPPPPQHTIIVNQCIPSHKIESLDRQDGIIWIKGEVDRLQGTSILQSKWFLLRGDNGHWEYDWKGGTSHRQRASLHQFRAYVFLPETAPDEAPCLRLLATATSIPFTLAAYRRDDSSSTSSSTSGSITVSSASASTSTATTPVASEAPVPATSIEPSTAQSVLWQHEHQDTARLSTALAILWLFVQQIDLRLFGRLPSSLVALVRDRWQHRLVIDSVNERLWDLDTLWSEIHLPTARFSPQYLDLAYQCIQVCTQLLHDRHWTAIYQHCIDAREVVLQPSAIQQTVVALVHTLAEQIDLLLRPVNSTLDQLTDEILSVMYTHEHVLAPSVLARVRQLQRNTIVLGVDVVVAQLQQLYQTFQTPPLSTPSRRRSRSRSSFVDGLWHLETVRLPQDSTLSEHPLPISAWLSAVALEVCVESDEGLAIRSVTSLFQCHWCRLVLDQRVQTCDVLPLGMACTAITFNPNGSTWICGDYRGLVDPNGIIELEFWSYALSESRARHLRFVLTSLDDHTLQIQVVVHDARLETTPVSMSQILSWSASDRLANLRLEHWTLVSSCDLVFTRARRSTRRHPRPHQTDYTQESIVLGQEMCF